MLFLTVKLAGNGGSSPMVLELGASDETGDM